MSVTDDWDGPGTAVDDDVRDAVLKAIIDRYSNDHYVMNMRTKVRRCASGDYWVRPVVNGRLSWYQASIGESKNMDVEIVDRITARQLDRGCDHGATGAVLLKTPTGRLVWRKGHMSWNGNGEPWVYMPCSLEWLSKKTITGKEIASGGRLSKKRLQSHRDKIAELAGVDDDVIEYVIASLSKKKTVIVNAPAKKYS